MFTSQVTAGLMAKIVDHVDTLLEDWYPDLGARFVQNSRGMYLITRIVPCNKCLLIQKDLQDKAAKSRDAWAMVDLSPSDRLYNFLTTWLSNIPFGIKDGNGMK